VSGRGQTAGARLLAYGAAWLAYAHLGSQGRKSAAMAAIPTTLVEEVEHPTPQRAAATPIDGAVAAPYSESISRR
jgi:hypothetical protein